MLREYIGCFSIPSCKNYTQLYQKWSEQRWYTFFLNTGVSDCHNIISTVIKGEVLHEPKKLRYYRSYKTFDIENFNDDIEQIKINQTCHEVDSVYNEYEKDFINVLNKHAPIKSRYQRKKPVPCMNQELRRAVYRKTNAIFSIYKMSEQQKLGKIQKAKKFCNQIEKTINENILFRTLLWGNKIGRLLENY